MTTRSTRPLTICILQYPEVVLAAGIVSVMLVIVLFDNINGFRYRIKRKTLESNGTIGDEMSKAWRVTQIVHTGTAS